MLISQLQLSKLVMEEWELLVCEILGDAGGQESL